MIIIQKEIEFLFYISEHRELLFYYFTTYVNFIDDWSIPHSQIHTKYIYTYIILVISLMNFVSISVHIERKVNDSESPLLHKTYHLSRPPN